MNKETYLIIVIGISMCYAMSTEKNNKFTKIKHYIKEKISMKPMYKSLEDSPQILERIRNSSEYTKATTVSVDESLHSIMHCFREKKLYLTYQRFSYKESKIENGEVIKEVMEISDSALLNHLKELKNVEINQDKQLVKNNLSSIVEIMCSNRGKIEEIIKYCIKEVQNCCEQFINNIINNNKSL
ncbi:uncharacterized protein LOC126907964 [Daktulosphaira vitifoliae]|uniref:uncharacterized protein LOC126907964 n=1 Tax=Daktulosphaira vitifoliae TaxID=58002 RepID=UPI0021A9CFBF|nr:uncharacterized protein LOC126907964 [Daktulosphaira vitifoliae]